MARISSRDGTLYIVRTVGYPAIKIGFTSLPLKKRIRDLQTGCPFDLQLVASRPGTKDEECALHDSLKEYRTRGEWFDLNGAPVAYLVEMASGQEA